MAEIARNAASTRQTGPAPVKIVEPTLPMYIERETRGILFDQSDPRRSVVLIGGDNFMVGEIIEGYENVWIKDVRLDSRPDPMAADQSVKVYTVVYSVTNEFNLTKDFEVRISGNATDSKMELGGMRERRFKQ
ncbi:MAG: hypothetical protein BWZ10_02588 [candidate division BRC1 bacterium ADurb.BinA364]|nr:MAG: hypothetical protein BWZ10_02588 [candidate division BRC1 bacterium ADurb.BinA364]